MTEAVYTLAQIEADINAFEGVTIVMPVAYSHRTFNMLYSQCFDKPMGDNATVDELKRRIDVHGACCMNN